MRDGAAMSTADDSIAVNTVNSTVTVPHWGITLRTLFGAALEAWPEGEPGESRDFAVILKGKHIADIHVKKHNPYNI